MTSKLAHALSCAAPFKPDGIADQYRRAAKALDITIESLGLSGAEGSAAFAKARQLYLVGKKPDVVVDATWLLPPGKKAKNG